MPLDNAPVSGLFASRGSSDAPFPDRPGAAPPQNTEIPATPALSDNASPGVFPGEYPPSERGILQIRAGVGASLIGIGIEGFTAPAAADPVNTVRKTIEEDWRASGLFQCEALLRQPLAEIRKPLPSMEGGGSGVLSRRRIRGVGGSVSVKLYDLTTGLTRFEAEYLVERNRPWYTATSSWMTSSSFLPVSGSFASRIACIGRTGSGNEILIIDADGRQRSQLTFQER